MLSTYSFGMLDVVQISISFMAVLGIEAFSKALNPPKTGLEITSRLINENDLLTISSVDVSVDPNITKYNIRSCENRNE